MSRPLKAPAIAVFFLLVIPYIPGAAAATDNTVFITNLTSSSATFVYLGDEAWVDVGGQRFHGTSSHGVCYVVTSNLDPNTTYEYTLPFGEKGSFNTLPAASLGLPSHIMYGKVEVKGGGDADGVAVILTISSSTADSRPLSCRVKDGYWLIDLAYVTDGDGRPFFYDAGYLCTIKVIGGNLGDGAKVVEVEAVEEQDCGTIYLEGGGGGGQSPNIIILGGIGVFAATAAVTFMILRRTKK